MSASDESALDDGSGGGVPIEHLHSERSRLFEQTLVEHVTRHDDPVIRVRIVVRPPHRGAGRFGSLAASMLAFRLVREAHVIDPMSLGGQVDLEVSERSDRPWGQQAATWLWCARTAFHDGDAASGAGELNRSRTACWTPTDDEHISRR
jgi:hypothetical protein